MNKKLFRLIAVLIAFAILITACGVGGADAPAAPATTTPTPVAAAALATQTPLPSATPLAVGSSPTPGTGPAATIFAPFSSPTPAAPAATLTTIPTATTAPTTVVPATAVPVTATTAPTATTPPVATPTTPPSASSCTSTDVTQFEYFQCFTQGFTDVALHGALIDRLDTLYLGVKREMNGGTITSTNDVVAFWMGDYVNSDPTQNGKLVRYLVDGDTGVWLIKPNTSVTIPVGFAYVRLQNWTGEVAPRVGVPALAKGSVQANGCVANGQIVPTIQAMLGQEEMFAKVDLVANANPEARVRNGWFSAVQALAGKTLVWTKTGKVGLGWAEVTRADGKSLYVAKLSGALEVMYPFSGLALCDIYPAYNTLPSVTVSAAPVEQNVCVENSKLAEIVNQSRTTTDLYLRLALLPSATHPKGTFATLWNSFIVTMGNAGGTNLMPIDWTQTTDGFRGLYFVTTDGTSIFDGMSAVITPCSAFSPKDAFPWWGTP